MLTDLNNKLSRLYIIRVYYNADEGEDQQVDAIAAGNNLFNRPPLHHHR